MASIIRLKRSGITTVPNTLASGELAYSWESSTGGKLYIGWGDEITSGVAPNIAAIGGKYYTDLVTDRISHTPGTLTANSAIIVNSQGKIDILNVDNITIDTNTISSSTGNIILSPFGTVDVSDSRITSVGAPTANTDAVNKLYVDTEIAALGTASELDFIADDGSNGSISLSSEVFTISGGTGLSSTASGNTLTIKLDDTNVVANTYGSSTKIPVLIVNEQGQITSATTADVATTLTISDGVGSDVVDLINDTLTISGGVGINSTVSNNEITIDLANTAVSEGSYGSANTVATFTVDQQGRLTVAANTSISISVSQIIDFAEEVQDVVDGLISANTEQGMIVTYTDSANTLVISASDASDTQKGVASFANTNFTVTGGNVVAKSITLGLTTLSLGGSISTLAGLTQLDVDNIQIDGSTISTTGTATDLNITPVINGDVRITTTGTSDIFLTVPNTREITVSTIAVSDLTSGRVVYTSTSGALVDSTNLTFDGTTLDLTGVLNVDDISIDGSTISSTTANTDIILDPNGSGTVNVSNSRITGVAGPEDGTDAATKTYVDTAVSAAIHYHNPVRVESPTALTANYDNGVDGVGATLTGASEVLIIDEITVALNDRVLIYTQANAAHNGVYYVSQVGVAGTTPWILTRTVDTDTYQASSSSDLGKGDAFYVKEGKTGAGELYVMTTTGTITFGSTAINFSQISSAQIYKAGAGLLLDGVTFSVDVDDISIGINGTGLYVKADGITNTEIANNTITNAKLVNSTITIAAQTGTADPISLGETITFAAGTGIKTEITANNTVTFSGVDATALVKGIATFDATDFTVSSGNVTLNTERVQDIIFNAIDVGANTGIDIDYNDAANTFIISGIDAAILTKGVASFGGWTNGIDSARQFSVTSGDVTIVSLDGGTF